MGAAAAENGLIYHHAPHLLYLKLLCALWLGAELFAYAISCPDKVCFLCSLLSLADIFCLFPVLMEWILDDKTEWQSCLSLMCEAMHSFYVLKLVHLLGFLDMFLAIRFLVHTLCSSWR